MKSIINKKEMIIWFILFIPIVYALYSWNKLPEQVPTHFNIQGQPDDYSDKAVALFVMPLMNIVVYLILLFIPRIDPRRKNYELFGASYQNIRLIIHLFFAGMFFYIIRLTMTGDMQLNNYFFAGMLLFFALLGNYMRTVRSNFFVGIRTPWTLSNDVVWKKTHELGGRIWFYSGIILAIIVLFVPETAAAVVMAAGVFLMAMVPVVYSYFEYKKVTAAVK